MKTPLLPAWTKAFRFALLVLAAANAGAIDFTPQYAESVQDGFPVRRLYFAQDKQRIYLAVPKDWSVAGNGQRGTFTPAAIPQGLVTLENSPLPANLPFDEKGLEIYRKAAAEVVPSGATEITTSAEKINEVQLNGWTSFEIAFYGQNFTRSVLFINLDQERQMRFRVEARKEHFDKLYAQARATLGSWFAPSPELDAALQRLAVKQ